MSTPNYLCATCYCFDCRCQPMDSGTRAFLAKERARRHAQIRQELAIAKQGAGR